MAGYVKMPTQPPLRAASLSEEEIGPGLYEGEVAVQFTSSTFAAILITQKWLENGEGVSVMATTRYIKSNGETLLTSVGQPIKTSYIHNFSHQDINDFNPQDLAREVALLALGEPPELMRDVPLEDGGTEQHPVLNVAENVRLSVSIKQAALAANEVDASPDSATVLGL